MVRPGAILPGNLLQKCYDELDIESSELVLNFNIGYYNNSGNNACSLAGVRVYNRVLSDGEIKILHEEFTLNSVGKKGICIPLDDSSKKAFIPVEEVSPLSETNVEIGTEGILIKGVSSNIFIPVLENTQISGGN